MIKLPNLSLIQDKFWNNIKNIKLEVIQENYRPEFDFTMFSQIWGSTALGFSGIGGQAMTKAYTTVIIEEYLKIAGVFFEDELAYIIKNPNDIFYKDLYNHRMNSVFEKSQYNK